MYSNLCFKDVITVQIKGQINDIQYKINKTKKNIEKNEFNVFFFINPLLKIPLRGHTFQVNILQAKL